MGRELITLVMPAYNEEGNLPILFDRVNKVVAKCSDFDWELLIIDNCSEDNTGPLAVSFTQKDPRWRYVRFSRNFGFETSVAAGTYYAKGDALIYLSTDLQDPPELIPMILKKWKDEKVDVVYGVLKARRDSTLLKTLGAIVAYRMIRALSDISIPVNATDFRLITRPVIEALKRCNERNRYMRGLVHWVGFRNASFTYDRNERVHGQSHAGLIFCINFAITAIMAFSYTPLRFASLLGMMVTAFSMLAGLFYTAMIILSHYGVHSLPTPPAGWATQVLLTLFFGGVQCLFLGIIGEYLGRVFNEVKNRPLWVIQETQGYRDGQDPLKVNP